MITREFAERSRTRVAEMRAVITKLRETSKAAIQQILKIEKQHDADRTRVYDRLGQLAEDVTEKLPEEASEADVDRAYAIKEQIDDLAANVEEVALTGSAIEDLQGTLKGTIDEIYGRLKEVEPQLTKVERIGAKLGI